MNCTFASDVAASGEFANSRRHRQAGHRRLRVAAAALFCLIASSNVHGQRDQRESEAVYPVAILAFQERGDEVQGFGTKVTDLVFANLADEPTLFLVDREDLNKQLAEQELSLSGLVRPEEAVRVGNLTGAKVLVTGSVLQVDATLYLVGKVIGTETSRVIGVSAKGPARDDLGELVEELAGKIAEVIGERANELVAKPVSRDDRIAALRKQLGRGKRPSVWIDILERHIGQATIDPAAETEIAVFCRELGFQVIDSDTGSARDADLLIMGEGLSEFAARHGNLISVRGRLEVKVVDRATDQIVAIHRQTSIGDDLSEQIAGKTALQEAAAQSATKLLPSLVGNGDNRRKRQRQ
jgi:TolB-like protein